MTIRIILLVTINIFFLQAFGQKNKRCELLDALLRNDDARKVLYFDKHKDVPIVFIEAELSDPSEFEQAPLMEIRESEDRIVISVKRCVSIAHVIAIIALQLSSSQEAPAEVHFGWSDENPMTASASFLLFGEGNIPWMVRELIAKAEPDRKKRPQVFIG